MSECARLSASDHTRDDFRRRLLLCPHSATVHLLPDTAIQPQYASSLPHLCVSVSPCVSIICLPLLLGILLGHLFVFARKLPAQLIDLIFLVSDAADQCTSNSMCSYSFSMALIAERRQKWEASIMLLLYQKLAERKSTKRDAISFLGESVADPLSLRSCDVHDTVRHQFAKHLNVSIPVLAH